MAALKESYLRFLQEDPIAQAWRAGGERRELSTMLRELLMDTGCAAVFDHSSDVSRASNELSRLRTHLHQLQHPLVPHVDVMLPTRYFPRSMVAQGCSVPMCGDSTLCAVSRVQWQRLRLALQAYAAGEREYPTYSGTFAADLDRLDNLRHARQLPKNEYLWLTRRK